MMQTNSYATPEATDFDFEALTADELGLMVKTPNPEEALREIEERLREIGLCSGK